MLLVVLKNLDKCPVNQDKMAIFQGDIIVLFFFKVV